MAVEVAHAAGGSGVTGSRFVGQRVARLEDARLLTGHGRFVDDISVRARTGWEVFLVTAGGASDIPVFDQFVATFQYTD